MKRLALVVILGACSNPPPPVEVSAGRLVARIAPEPAQITLLLDGNEVWRTEAGAGDGTPPNGFASRSSKSVMIDGQFGSFRFIENADLTVWQPIDKLANVVATSDGATFDLVSDDRTVGTGSLTFDASVRSGPDPDAAGFPRHVRIVLAVDTGDSVSLSTPCPTDEHLVGLGGQTFEVDHRGQHVPLWVQEDGIGKYPDADDNYQGVWFLSGRRHSTHTPMPMMLSSKGYALAVDTNARVVFDLAHEHPTSSRFEAWDRTLDLQVFIGDPTDPIRDAFGHLIAWAGKPDRPPPQVFAPWVDAIYGSASVRQVASALRANGISSSVIWTEDWRGGGDTALGYALAEHWRVDRTLYPDIEQLASDLHGEGFQFLVYHNTFVDSTSDVYAEATAGGYTIRDATGGSYSFTGVKLDPSTMLDLTNPAGVAWAKSVMGEALALGADGWMADFGEWQPVDAQLASGESALAQHNRNTVDWARFNHELLAQALPGRPQPIYFMRSAWLHSQPHAQVIWAGDQQTDWSDGDGLPSVVPDGLGLGLAGFPYWGSDVAGYMSQGTTTTDEELFYRWVPLGALSPVMRTHHGRNARENFQWQHDANSIAHFRRWARFHQQLAAYLEGSCASFERDGLPLFRLIALDHPGDDWAWSAMDEYLLGDRLLVAPIQMQGAVTRDVQLPAGTWIPLLGGPAVQGTITATAPLTEIPAFVPEGALLVMYADGIDTELPAPALPTATTLASKGGDREVWLYPGTPATPAIASWHDTAGVTAAQPQWTWTGRTGALPTAATWNGAPVIVAQGAGFATIAVTGDGTLELAGGGTLVVSHGDPSAHLTVRVWGS